MRRGFSCRDHPDNSGGVLVVMDLDTPYPYDPAKPLVYFVTGPNPAVCAYKTYRAYENSQTLSLLGANVFSTLAAFLAA